MTKTMTTEDRRIALFAKALSNPTRVAILRILKEQGNCTCGESCAGENCKCGCNCGSLVDMFPMAQSTISQHIKELKSAGLINLSCRKGNYTLNHNIINEGVNSILDLFDKTNSNMEEKNNCNCGENCQCGDNCNCGDNCQCGDNYNCGDNCQCGNECNCGEGCDCGDNCTCNEENKCNPQCTCNQ